MTIIKRKKKEEEKERAWCSSTELKTFAKGFTLSCKTHSSEGSTPSSPKALRARAFTLAEVLLTLVIIGVIAALTIPAVITKMTKDQYVTALRKAFNTLKQVEREAIREHGEMANWDWAGGDSETVFKRYFKSHFDILRDCGLHRHHNSADTCFAKTYVMEIDRSSGHVYTIPEVYGVVTSDGIAYGLNLWGSYNPAIPHMGVFYVDINGAKGPNHYDRDLFVFDIFWNSGIKPSGSYHADGKTPMKSSDTATMCPAVMEEISYCASKVLSEGAMNY